MFYNYAYFDKIYNIVEDFNSLGRHWKKLDFGASYTAKFGTIFLYHVIALTLLRNFVEDIKALERHPGELWFLSR